MRRFGAVVSLLALLLVAAPAAEAAEDVVALKVPKTILSGDAVALAFKLTSATGASAKATAVLRLARVEGAPGSIAARLKVPALARGGKVTVRAKVVIPAGVPPGRVLFTVCVGSRCSAAVAVTLLGGSSYDRIARARLPLATRLIDELYALTADPRLPKPLRGHGAIPEAVVMAEVADAYPTVAPGVQRQLLPYLLPPVYRESAWGPKAAKPLPPVAAIASVYGARHRGLPCENLTVDTAWLSIPAAGNKALVWYRAGDAAAALRLTAAMPKIWTTEAGVFGEPKPDNGAGCNPGGDPRYDIYVGSPATLTPFDANGVRNEAAQTALGITVPLAGDDRCISSTFIIVKPTETRATLAHEFFHAIQFNHPGSNCMGNETWIEGSAMWAEDFVYHGDRSVNPYGGHLDDPEAGLLTLTYPSWPFWTWLYHSGGTAAIKGVFAALASAPLRDALPTAVPNGLAANWKTYSVLRLNTTPIGTSGFPVRESFKRWNAFAEAGSPLEVDLKVSGKGPIKPLYLGAVAMPPLSTSFSRVKLPDRRVRAIVIANHAYGTPGGQLQGLVKLANGQWQVRDWSDRANITLCRDAAADDVRELYLVLGNASTTSPLAAVNVVGGRTSCAFPELLTGTWTRVISNPTRGTWRETIHGTGSFRRPREFPPEAEQIIHIPYVVVEASVTWTVSGTQTEGSCTTTFSGSGSVGTAGNSELWLQDVGPWLAPGTVEPKPFYYSLFVPGDPLSIPPTYTVTTTGKPDCQQSSTESLITWFLEVGARTDYLTLTPDLVPLVQKSATTLALIGHSTHGDPANASPFSYDDSWSFAAAG